MPNKDLNTSKFKVKPDDKVKLKDYDPGYCDGLKDKDDAKEKLERDIERISDLQYELYAENKRSLLIIFQAMDSAGKDSAIKHVFSGVNPQGCQVHSFKKPSTNELEHDFLWRHYVRLPERGQIGIFNRSHYENVLITKVHPELILYEQLPHINEVSDITPEFWENRYRQINDFEKTLVENGTTVIKFFLHLSKEEQKKRFLKRIEKPKKHWKFSSADIHERQFWEAYQKAYEQALSATSTKYSPWYIIPADNKWFSQVVIGKIIAETLEEMSIKMPKLSDEEFDLLGKAKETLLSE